MSILNKTEGLCNICFAKIPAETFARNGRVFIQKKCEEHGSFVTNHFWDDPEIYNSLLKLRTIPQKSAQVTLIITNKCNLNCPVCFAKANELDARDMNFEDIEKLDFYRSVFISGGEPTIRQDLPKIIRMLRRRKSRIILFSNGIKLANKKYAKLLRKSGLGCVILQFDTLDDKLNQLMRGRKMLDIKKQAIENLEELGVKIISGSVMLRGKNFNHLREYFKFCFSHPAIKTMGINPLKEIGRYPKKDFVPSSEIIEKSNKILKLNKNDWIESTRFLLDIDKLMSVIKKRNRVFSKCRLRCFFFLHKGECISLSKVFSLGKINQKIVKIYLEKRVWKAYLFLISVIWSEFILNFFYNRNYRLFIVELLKNATRVIQNKSRFLNPFRSLCISVYPTQENLDFDFIKGCNFNIFNPENSTYRPACLHRLSNYFKQESKL